MSSVSGNSGFDPRRRAWAYLSKVAAGPCAAMAALIDMVGVREAARAVADRDLPETLQKRTAARRHIDTSAEDLQLMHRLGGRLVTPDDDDWPAWRMLSFNHLDPRGTDEGEPLALWVLGSMSPAEVTDRAIAVVGARAISPYGEQVARDMAGELAERGYTIVSGAAYGVDAAAHRAALATRTPTVAVLAAGVDRPYPAGHVRLLAEIARCGLVVSEYAPGTMAAKHRFLVRNRLVAALADAVLVVEAGKRSGARNTTTWARRLGRPALAVPGPVDSAMSVGCHRMIRDGEALLVTDAREVAELLAPHRPGTPASQREAGRGPDTLTGTDLAVYNALPAYGGMTADELADACNADLSSIRATLPALELRGRATLDDEGWRRVGNPAM